MSDCESPPSKCGNPGPVLGWLRSGFETVSAKQTSKESMPRSVQRSILPKTGRRTFSYPAALLEHPTCLRLLPFEAGDGSLSPKYTTSGGSFRGLGGQAEHPLSETALHGESRDADIKTAGHRSADF